MFVYVLVLISAMNQFVRACFGRCCIYWCGYVQVEVNVAFVSQELL